MIWSPSTRDPMASALQRLPSLPFLCTSLPFPGNHSSALLDEGWCTWQTGDTSVLPFLGTVNSSAAQGICLAIPSAAQLSILYSRSMNEPKPLFAFSSNCPPPRAWDLWKFVARVAEPRYFSQAWCPTATAKITPEQLLSQNKGDWMHLLPKDHNAKPGKRRSRQGGQWMRHSLSLNHFSCRNS